ncbi:MAG: Hsp70 family protein, partial [Ensifer adhaerens]
IDKVFLTGGTSFVPAVRNLFERRFEKDRIESGGELLSIAHGLALIGEHEDIGHWTANAA